MNQKLQPPKMGVELQLQTRARLIPRRVREVRSRFEPDITETLTQLQKQKEASKVIVGSLVCLNLIPCDFGVRERAPVDRLFFCPIGCRRTILLSEPSSVPGSVLSAVSVSAGRRSWPTPSSSVRSISESYERGCQIQPFRQVVLLF